MASLFLWYIPAGLAILGFLIPPGREILWPVAFLWVGGSCIGNAIQCRRIHCSFTGPLYLLIGLVAIGKILEWFSVAWTSLWIAIIAGTLLSFIPEWGGRIYWSNRKS